MLKTVVRLRSRIVNPSPLARLTLHAHRLHNVGLRSVAAPLSVPHLKTRVRLRHVHRRNLFLQLAPGRYYNVCVHDVCAASPVKLCCHRACVSELLDPLNGLGVQLEDKTAIRQERMP